jgi:uncharacterized protein (DUF2236 family)
MERPAPGGITWTIAGERLALLAWPRAILLQLAHPLVAAGVAQHSTFRASPLAPFARLHATVGAFRELTFGSDDAAARVVQRILGIHDRVQGTLQHAAGPHGAGARYSAHDPALLLWVHATLLDSHVRILEPILRPFTTEERDHYCREAAPYAVILGAVADDVPRTWQGIQDYLRQQIESGWVTVGADARGLAPDIIRPAFGWPVWPLRYAGELLTVGSLPPVIRDAYGFAWSDARQRRHERLLATLRAVRRATPDLVARWPEARSGDRAAPAGSSISRST